MYVSGLHYRRGFQFLPTLSGWSPHPPPGPTLTSPSGAAPPTLVPATVISHLSPARGSGQGSRLPPASLPLSSTQQPQAYTHVTLCYSPAQSAPDAHYTQNKNSGSYNVIRRCLLSRLLSLTHSSAHTSMSHMHSCSKVFLSAWTTLPANICTNGSSFQSSLQAFSKASLKTR